MSKPFGLGTEERMSKPIPLQAGHYYHVYNRGTNGENVFIQERNYQHFLRLYAHYIEPVADTFAYCLLKNHFHLLIRVKAADETRRVSETLRVSVSSVSQQFSNLFNAYAKAINIAYQRTGSLFEHPFHRIEVDNEPYFARLVVYIHQNPKRHGFTDDFRSWPYSSYQTLLSRKETRLRREGVWRWFQGVEGMVAAHRREISEADMAALAPDDFD